MWTHFTAFGSIQIIMNTLNSSSSRKLSKLQWLHLFSNANTCLSFNTTEFYLRIFLMHMYIFKMLYSYKCSITVSTFSKLPNKAISLNILFHYILLWYISTRIGKPVKKWGQCSGGSRSIWEGVLNLVVNHLSRGSELHPQKL